MLRAAVALGLVLALGGQLDGLLARSDRPEAHPAPPQVLPAEPGPMVAMPWPEDGRLACAGACQLLVPPGNPGELWVSWDGTAVQGFVAALDGLPGVPGFDAVRVGDLEGGETLRLWGRGDVVLSVLAHRDDVPDLVALPPAHLGQPLGPERGYGAPALGARECLEEEVVDLGVRDCLRFTTGVANAGAVPLALASQVRDGEVRMTQELPGDDHEAGLASYHAAHGHFHYARFMAFDLHRVEASGLRGEAVLSTSKTGFCMVDWGAVSDVESLATKTYWRDGCEAHQRHLEMGVNPGWYDIYRWFLPEQAIDVAGLPEGTYELVAVADPDGTLVEDHTLNNRASTRFTWADGIATPIAQHGLYRI